MSVVAMGYDEVAEEPLEELREEVKPREVELKKTEVDTGDDN